MLLAAAPSASVVKAMLLVAYLRRDGARERALWPAERALLGPMIRRSDSAAASQVCNVVGTGGLERLARRARMRRFHATRPWGLSTIDAADPPGRPAETRPATPVGGDPDHL